MNTNLPHSEHVPLLPQVVASEFSFDDQLLEIYWAKKELDEFLPKIAGYAKPHEVANITLSQLSIIEKRIVWILEAEAKGLLKHSVPK